MSLPITPNTASSTASRGRPLLNQLSTELRDSDERAIPTRTPKLVTSKLPMRKQDRIQQARFAVVLRAVHIVIGVTTADGRGGTIELADSVCEHRTGSQVAADRPTSHAEYAATF